MRFDIASLVLLGLGAVSANPISRSSWPYGPFVTSGRWIVNQLGKNVTYAGVNWPGAADVMIPEGLQYAPISTIVSGIKSLGMNVIRLTFAIEMVDDIYENVNSTVAQAFNTALGTTNGAAVFKEVLKYNPWVDESTTRVEIYDAIAAECFKQQIYVHLDNHMSKGEWCCSNTDGNAWFGDTYFNVDNWKRGLAYMVKRGSSWGNLVSIGMRNELREPDDNATLVSTSYGWPDWYKYMTSGASVIHASNPDVLIFMGGIGYDTTLAPIVAGTDLGSGVFFKKTSFSFANKIVFELHDYQNSATECSAIQGQLTSGGFTCLESDSPNQTPMVLTEWGHDQTDASWDGTYAQCLASYLLGVKVGWMTWALGGSYYIRSGVQDYDETWGLYNHNWTAWRSADNIAFLKTMVKNTLA